MSETLTQSASQKGPGNTQIRTCIQISIIWFLIVKCLCCGSLKYFEPLWTRACQKVYLLFTFSSARILHTECTWNVYASTFRWVVLDSRVQSARSPHIRGTSTESRSYIDTTLKISTAFCNWKRFNLRLCFNANHAMPEMGQYFDE